MNKTEIRNKMNLVTDFAPLIALIINSVNHKYLVKDPREIFIKQDNTKEEFKKELNYKIAQTQKDYHGAYLLYQVDLTQYNYNILIENIEMLKSEGILEDCLSSISETYSGNILENENGFIGNINLFKLPKKHKMLRTITKTKSFTHQHIGKGIDASDFPLRLIENILDKNSIKDDVYLAVLLQDEVMSFILLDQENFEILNTSILRLLWASFENLKTVIHNLEYQASQLEEKYNQIKKTNMKKFSGNFGKFDAQKWFWPSEEERDIITLTDAKIMQAVKRSNLFTDMLDIEIINTEIQDNMHKVKTLISN